MFNQIPQMTMDEALERGRTARSQAFRDAIVAIRKYIAMRLLKGLPA